jgi:hypothetical protein
MNTDELSIGTKVHYCPKFGDKENGIVKGFNFEESIVFVVYKCNGDWANYRNYTGCATNLSDLKLGWV